MDELFKSFKKWTQSAPNFRYRNHGTMENDFYSILLEAKRLGDKELIRTYRTLALRCHPDKTEGRHEDMTALTNAFRQVKTASSNRHKLGGSADVSRAQGGGLLCEVCGEEISIEENALLAGFSEFECHSCGFVLYIDK